MEGDCRQYSMYTSFVLHVGSILLCGLCHYMRWIIILSVYICNGINALLGFVNMASAICMLTIVMLCHTVFVVHVVKSAIVATYMQVCHFKDDKADLTTLAFIPDPSKCQFVF